MDVKQFVDVSCEYVDELKQSQAEKTQRWESYVKACIDDWWLLELLCLLAGLSLMVGLCLLLRYYDGQPVPNFGETIGTAITLNTIISIFSLVIQACLMYPIIECISQLKWVYLVLKKRRLSDFQVFDTASRGALGSVVLICKLGLRSFATIGALLMITAVALTPILQQLVSFATHQVALPITESFASVPVTQIYNSVSQPDDSIGVDFRDGLQALAGQASRSMPSGLDAAVNLGFYAQNETLSPLAPSCIHGNCTFASYQTLAICGHITNISELAQVRNITGDTELTVLLPTDPPVTMVYEPGYASGILMNITSVPDYQLLSHSGHVSTFSDAIILATTLPSSFRPGYSAGPNGGPLSGYAPIAFEISFNWCVQNYSTTTTNGIASTEAVQSYAEFTPINDPYTGVGGNISMNDTGLSYSYGLETHRALQDHFGQMFNGTFKDSSGDMYATTAYIQAIWESLNSTDGSHQDGANLKMIVDNIATSMTNYIRSSSAAPYQNGTARQIAGIAYADKTLVTIRWQWISGPAIFAVLTIIFVLLTITLSNLKGKRVQNWKSSSLATLAAPDFDLRETIGGLAKPIELDTMAKELHVQLESISGGHGWTLVQK